MKIFIREWEKKDREKEKGKMRREMRWRWWGMRGKMCGSINKKRNKRKREKMREWGKNYTEKDRWNNKGDGVMMMMKDEEERVKTHKWNQERSDEDGNKRKRGKQCEDGKKKGCRKRDGWNNESDEVMMMMKERLKAYKWE